MPVEGSDPAQVRLLLLGPALAVELELLGIPCLHASAVVVERYQESPRGVLEMDALVVVEKDSQRGILIGSKGETMKRVASQARQEMEALLGTRVFLQVWVKVVKNWRMDRRLLDRLGLEEIPVVKSDSR